MPVDPQIQAMLDKGTGVPQTHTLSVTDARQQYEARIAIMAEPAAVAAVEERTIDGPGGPLRLRTGVEGVDHPADHGVDLHKQVLMIGVRAKAWQIEKLRQEGDRVALGDRIYTVADLSRVWIFFDAYEDAVRHAQEFPHAGAIVLESTHTVRKFPFEGFPFHIVTSVIDDTLVVVAVAHVKRKPGDWVERVK